MQRYVLLDMNTQRDFLDADGTCPINGPDSLIPKLRKVFSLARTYHIPVVSALDSHRENELPNGLPRHCFEGSSGQKKLRFTLLRNRTFVEANNNLDLPMNLLDSYRQVILRRRTEDFFGNPKADRLLTDLRPERFILFGVGLERSIRRLALSLLARGKRIAVVPEACGYWSATDADLTVRLILAKHGLELTVEELGVLFERASRVRMPRVFSRARRKTTKSRRSLAG